MNNGVVFLRRGTIGYVAIGGRRSEIGSKMEIVMNDIASVTNEALKSVVWAASQIPDKESRKTALENIAHVIREALLAIDGAARRGDTEVLSRIKKLCITSIGALDLCRPAADYRDGMRFAYKEILDIIEDAEEHE